MSYPDYFEQIKSIILYDDLAEFLGSAEDGIIEISYTEIVKMAGHSCAVVGGAYLMALMGLKSLYGNEIPRRGQIKVELQSPLEEGNTGVTASVLSNITGATATTGFTGIQGKFVRRRLMFFGVNMDATARFTRLDTGSNVEIKYHPNQVVQPGKILMPVLSSDATDEQKQNFPYRWQEMVRTIFEKADSVIDITVNSK